MTDAALVSAELVRRLGVTTVFSAPDWEWALAKRPTGFAPDKWAEFLLTMTAAWNCSLPYAVGMTLNAVKANGGRVNNYYGSIDGEVI